MIVHYRHPSSGPEANSPWGGMAPPVGLSRTHDEQCTFLAEVLLSNVRNVSWYSGSPPGRTVSPPSVGCMIPGLQGCWWTLTLPKATDVTPRLQTGFLTTPAATDFPLVRWNCFRVRRHYTAHHAACSAPNEVARYPDNILRVPGRTDGILVMLPCRTAGISSGDQSP